MDIHTTRGFSPLNGQEIKKAICGSLYAELDKYDQFSLNLAYPIVKWEITVTVHVASSAHAQPDAIPITTEGIYEQTKEDGSPIKGSELSGADSITLETEHEVEFPDLTRETFIGEKPAEPESANVAVAPTKAGVESYPEKFQPGKGKGRGAR
jgi:hypothetical protein